MSRLRTVAFVVVALVVGLAARAAPDNSRLPPAIRGVNPDLLSGGLFSAFDAQGAFGALPPPPRARAGGVNLAKGKPPLVLDARVGTNIRVGDDPAVLPSTQSGQAEPHIARNVANPTQLLATFQDGRYRDAGAIDCGYALSQNGGLTWTRALIPQLTTASGGPYLRATDPVAACGPQGELYLNTLASVSGAFDLAAVVVSRSTDGGTTWSAPSVVFQSTTTQVMPDKNWMAVNDYAGTPNAGRLVVTWTNFTSTASGASTGNNLLASISNDRGATWSAPVAITPPGAANQGSQPVFLPDGSLVVVYASFRDVNTASSFDVQCKRSTDGGATFTGPASTIAPAVSSWDDPDLREGVYLPAATVARQTGAIFATYTGVVAGSPRVLVARSTDQGTTWSTPVVVSDNPSGVSVMNPAIAVTPDGQTVSVVFMDKRNAPDGHNFVDHYVAQSFDGGVTWQANVRLTEMSSDIRYAPPTTRGYMLGDYLGVAPSLATDQPCVAIWCDTRTGDSDPFTVRFAAHPEESLSAWELAHGDVAPATTDTDQDGFYDAVEYWLGTNPTVKESGETFVVHQVSPGVFDVAWVERATGTANAFPVTTAPNPGPSGIVDPSALASATPLTGAQLPAIALAGNLKWVGTRFTASPAAAFSVGHALKFSAGIPPYVYGEVAYANTDARLINVSTRGVVGTGASQMIVGFVIDGGKTILLRAAGPALTGFGVTAPLAAPQLMISPSGSTTTLAATTAGWQTSTATADLFTRLGAFPFPAGSSDAALVRAFTAGGYTAVVSGAGAATGTALVEAYDADPLPGAVSASRLLDLSTRGMVGAGDANALIAGFVIHGTQPRRVLIRAVGPSLATFGLTGQLSDPVLTVTALGASAALATNDDWEISRSAPAIAATAQRLGAFPLNAASLDAALLITVPPGGYTVTVTGAQGATGIALVEVYDAD